MSRAWDWLNADMAVSRWEYLLWVLIAICAVIQGCAYLFEWLT